jgi:hypothetical protein
MATRTDRSLGVRVGGADKSKQQRAVEVVVVSIFFKSLLPTCLSDTLLLAHDNPSRTYE